MPLGNGFRAAARRGYLVGRYRTPGSLETMHRSVLLVDDDQANLRLLTRFFTRLGWVTRATVSPQEAVALYESERPSLVILDLRMPRLSGIELLEILRDRDPDPAIIMLTGAADVESAVAAMRLGAHNYLTKPVALEHLEVVTNAALETVTLRRANRQFARLQGEGAGRSEIQARSLIPDALSDRVVRLMESDVPVLLQGETGTGKGWLARLIHSESRRASAPFSEVECATLSDGNLEERLFGAERSTSRGRRVELRGLVEAADGGTLFFDQIDLLDPVLQPRLLGLLASGRFRRRGGEAELSVDVRVIAASTLPLAEEVAAGRFRHDLYHRVAGFPLQLPPLRERRRGELLELSRALLHGLGSGGDDSPPVRIAPEAAELLARYTWPGNVRELLNVLQRVVTLNPNVQEVLPVHLPAELTGAAEKERPMIADPTLPLDQVERLHIRAALAHFGGNKSLVARSLGIGRRTLYDKLSRFGLE